MKNPEPHFKLRFLTVKFSLIVSKSLNLIGGSAYIKTFPYLQAK